MKYHRLAALGVVLVVAILLVAAAPALAGNMPRTNIPYDATPLLKSMPAPHQNHPITLLGSAATAAMPTHNGVPADLILTLYNWDPAHPGAYDVPFWKEYVGEHSDIYVGWDNLASAPESLQQDQTITADQVSYIGQEFDKRIWESDVFHFGNYQPRAPEGVPNFDGKRAAIFVHNIRDEAYYGPFRYYIAGYFWAGLNDYLGLNAIFVDSYNWKDRTGADSARPFLYEATVAHEFQHLIHNDVDPYETEMVNEGMADLAEQFLYGTKTTNTHIGEYLYYHRDSLTDWTGELYDYGNAVLWQDYLWEQMGGGKLGAPLADRIAPAYANDKFADTPAKFTDRGDRFTWNLIHDQKTGLASIADWVGGAGNVERLHRDFTLANLLDAKAVTDRHWSYRNLALGGPDSDNLTIDDGIAYYAADDTTSPPPTFKHVRRSVLPMKPWGAYYRTFTGSRPGFVLSFVGTSKDGIAPPTGTYEWYGGVGNLLERTLTRQIDGVLPGSTLTFSTWYDIEDQWDYGYVEASSDGSTWTQLPQKTSLPAGVEDVNGSAAWSDPGGLTGNSGGWMQAQYDLTGYSGTVFLRFRYATDESGNGQGWYVDDISIGTAFVDPVDATNGWATDPIDGWQLTTGLQQNDWTADAYAPYSFGRMSWYTVQPLVRTAGIGRRGVTFVATRHLTDGKAYGIVSNRPDGTFDSTGRLTILNGN